MNANEQLSGPVHCSPPHFPHGVWTGPGALVVVVLIGVVVDLVVEEVFVTIAIAISAMGS